MIIDNIISDKIKIFVVEDDFFATKIATMILEKMGCLVDCVSTGKEAMGRDMSDYNLVLLDLGLPDVNGFEVAKFIRKSYNSTILPIIILTAHEDDEKVELAKQLSINGFFIKPFTQEKCDLLLSQFIFPYKNGNDI
jgi:DNA-binding response OmpR family regulator